MKISVFILIIVLFGYNAAFGQKSPEYMRAEYLLYIIKQVDYINEKKIETFRIGLLGDEKGIYNSLIEQSKDLKTPLGKPVEIVLFSSIDEISNVQMLYVNKEKNFDIGKVILKTSGTHTLIVSENYEFQKSMLNFIVVDNILRFEINKARFETEGLEPKPLFAAKAIRDKADWEKLYISTEKELVEEQIIVEAQIKQIDEQKKEIERQKKEIQEQEEKITLQKKEIAEQQERINKQKFELNNLIKNIKTQQKVLQEKMALLEEQQVKLTKQQEEIVERNRKLNEQKAEIEKQESKITEQKEVLSDQLEKIETQRLIMYLFFIMFLMVSGLGYFIYRSYKIKKRANKLLHEKNVMIMERNEEIMQQKEEITAQRDEIEIQRDKLKIINQEILQAKEEIEAQRDEIERQKNVAEAQRDEIMEQKREITDSILYARRIQTAILPPREFIGKNLRKYFILNKPRDIVSGDYYWITEKDDKIIVAAADCTGHGVPGAFMSMLGVALLNQIVGEESILRANEILNHLREDVINSLRQTGKEGEAKDGMDIALCVFDTENRQLQFAGANNPMYYVRKISEENRELALKDELPRHIAVNENYELIEHKADKMPIGIYAVEELPFTNNEFNLTKGDTIYIFSDGFADQFGGPAGKKFKYKPFKQLLLSVQDKEMKEQEQLLNNVIEEWKGEEYEQVDDILVIGVRM
ncbi:MAG: YfiR/HmsC family protein [Bacteroidota bacterium]